MSAVALRVDGQPGYVLHAYPYKETSLLVEAFTGAYGRLPLIAKGARRPRSDLRGVLQAFQPLVLGWSGRGEVRSLSGAEWRGGLPLLQGPSLLCGFYLNELLLKLLPRDDPHPGLFEQYETTLRGLAEGEDLPALLRRFELRLLAELGYGLELARDAQTGRPLVAEARYHYVVERGAIPAREPASAERGRPLVHGATLLALADGRFPDARSAAEAKQLMRDILNHHLEQRALFSRQLIRDLQALEAPPQGDR